MSVKDVGLRKTHVRELMEQDRQRLLLRFPFCGGIAMRLNLTPVSDSRLKTSATDFRNIYVDVDFYAKLLPDERLFVLAHEIWHVVLLHGMRRCGRDKKLFDVAADIEVQFLLGSEGLSLPFALPHRKTWAGKSAEEIYELLLEKEGALAAGLSTEGQMGHETPRLRGSEGEGRFDRHLEPRRCEGEAVEDVENGGACVDDEYSDWLDVGAVDWVRGCVMELAQQIDRTRGSLPGFLKQVVRRYFSGGVNWRDQLAQFMTSCHGGSRRWLPPSRRHLGRGLYLQSLRHEKLKAVLVIDTSESVSRDLSAFVSELQTLMKLLGSYELKVIQCDAVIQSVVDYDESRDLTDNLMELKGGGGTDLRPPFECVADNGWETDIECLVYLTDGYGPAPEKAPNYPVLWALTSDGKVPAGWGMVVRIG